MHGQVNEGKERSTVTGLEGEAHDQSSFLPSVHTCDLQGTPNIRSARIVGRPFAGNLVLGFNKRRRGAQRAVDLGLDLLRDEQAHE